MSGSRLSKDEPSRDGRPSYRVGLIPGDGIGPEVIAEAVKVVAATGIKLDTVSYDLGAGRYLRTGDVLPSSVLDELRQLEAILLGAVGPPVDSTEVPAGLLERGLLLKLRFELDLYINLRPFSPVPGSIADGADLVVVRENTEGSYAGEGGVLRKGTKQEVATQGSVNTRFGVERCVRFAFDLARSRQRKSLTLVHKANVLTFAGDLWRRVFDDLGEGYPDVSRSYDHVDASCIYLVESPLRYDVIVTDNLFGDIITDLAAAITGGIGLAASGNINPDRTAPSMFEPVHGSAPDIAGQQKADPTAAILSTSLLLDHLGYADASAAVEAAVLADLAERQAGTTRRTSEVGDAIAGRL